ncbi:MAG: hypothetical protein IIX60_03825 [Clostridia bacterium]|nr:hypothetical protein [Clostridia bacterium]
MKKLLVLLLVVLSLVSVSACGKGDNSNGSQQGGTQSTVSTEKNKKELAESCIDKSVTELKKLIGEPQSSEYVPSCLSPGKGEDGNLFYDGFTVYTYRYEGKETVTYVE